MRSEGAATAGAARLSNRYEGIAMKRFAVLVLALAGILGPTMLGGCSTDPYAPYDFKRVPGYTPPGGISSPARLTNLPLESQH